MSIFIGTAVAWSPPIGDIDHCWSDWAFEDVAYTNKGFDYQDIISLYEHLEDFRSKNWTSSYDFNDDGNLDFMDVLILAHKLYDYGEIDLDWSCAIPPRDLDGDGIPEDMNGDSMLGISDAIVCGCSERIFNLIPPKIPGYPYPYDLDGDMKFEDMNGDKKLTIDDIVIFYDNLNWISENWGDKADFNGDSVVDINDVEALFKKFENSVKAIKFTINLTKGHNFISIPLKVIVNESIFGPIEIWEWDAQNQTWIRVHEIVGGKGYYVYSPRNVSVTIEGEPLHISADIIASQLKEGWNLIGVGIDPIRVGDIINTLEQFKNFIYYGSNTSIEYHELTYNGSDYMLPYEMLQPGKAYWVEVFKITKTIT